MNSFLSLKNKSVEIYPNTKNDILKKIENCLKQSQKINPKKFDPCLIYGSKSRGIHSHDRMVLSLWFSIEDLAETIPEAKREIIASRVMDKAKDNLIRNFGIKDGLIKTS